MVPETLAGYSVVECANAYEISRVAFDRIAKRHHIELSRKSKRSTGFLRAANLGGISIVNLGFSDDVRINGSTDDDCYYIHRVYSGAIRMDNSGKCAVVDHENIAIMEPGSSVSLQCEENSRELIIRLNRKLLEQQVEEIIGRLPGVTVNFQPFEYLKNTDASNLIRLIDFVCGDLDSSSSMAKNKFSVAHMERLIASSLLTSIPNNFSELIRLKNSAVYIPSALRRMEEFIARNIAEAIQLEDLVEVSEKGVKRVYELFEQYHQTTPMTYLKEFRYKNAREELQNINSRYSSVAEVAMSVGLVHLGNFAAEYQNRYHELPSCTLRKRNIVPR